MIRGALLPAGCAALVALAAAGRAAEIPGNWHGAPPLPARSGAKSSVAPDAQPGAKAAPAPPPGAARAPAKQPAPLGEPVRPMNPGKDPEGRASALLKLAERYREQKKFPEAIDAASDAIQLLETKFGSGDRRLAPALRTLGGIHWRQGRREEAEPYYRRATALLEKSGGSPLELAHALSEQAKLYLNSRREAEAVPLQRRALSIYEQVYKNDPQTLRTYLTIAANTEKWAGNYDEALKLLARAAALSDTKDPASRAFVEIDIATVYAKQGRHAEAVKLFEGVIAAYEKRFGRDHRALAVPWNEISASLAALGRMPEAEAAKRRADEVSGRRPAPLSR